jgi:basic membrane protein A and related proteins
VRNAVRHPALALLVGLSLLLAACGGGTSGGQGGSGGVAGQTQVGGSNQPVFKPQCQAPGGKTYKVALVVAQGGLGDQSYNDLAYSGFTKAQSDFPVQGRVIQSNDIVSQGRSILQQAGQQGFDLVIDLEFSTGDALKEVAPAYPNTKWMIVNLPSNAPNVTGYLFDEQDGSFLAGAMATLVAENPRIKGIRGDRMIGAIGGIKSTGIDKFLVGYIQGAHQIDPKMQVLTAYANNFGDPATGKQLADSQFSQGADIVYQVAGGTGAGVIQAAQQAGRYAVGVDTDQDSLAPGHVLTSMVKRTDFAVYDAIDRMVCGTLKGGDSVTLGLKQGGVGLSPMKFTKNLVPDADVKKVDDLRQQIQDGKIKVWNVITQGYPPFYK